MPYRGRYQLGTTVELQLLARSAAGTATLPDNPPVVKIFNSSGSIVRNKEMPITERYSQTGLFHLPVFLDADFAVGNYRAVYYFRVGSDYGIEEDGFEVVAGGDVDGEIVNMAFYQRPHASFVVQSTETGKIIGKRNPTV